MEKGSVNKYKVIANLNHDGKDYAIGDTVEMTAEQAHAIPWAVKELSATDSKDYSPSKEGSGSGGGGLQYHAGKDLPSTTPKDNKSK